MLLKIKIYFIVSLFSVLILACGSVKEKDEGETDTRAEGPESRVETTEPEVFSYETGPGSIFTLVEAPEVVSDNLRHESIKGYSYIMFDGEKWNPGRLQTGDIISVHLPDDLKPEAKIRRVRKSGNLVSLTADIMAPYRGMISLTSEDNRTVGSVEMYNERRTFHIRYDNNAGMIYMAEVDVSKLDIEPGSPPAIPGQQEVDYDD